MDQSQSNSVRDGILRVIAQQDGQLGWHRIANALGAETFEDSAGVFLEIRSLEQSGVIRRDAHNGAVRFWIVNPGGLLQ